MNTPNIIVVKNSKGTIVLVGEPGKYSLKSDNPELLKEARSAIKTQKRSPLIPGRPNRLFTSGSQTLISLLTAMVSTDPNNSIIEEAPEMLINEIKQNSK